MAKKTSTQTLPSLPDLIAGLVPSPSSALLLTYEAHLPFLERVVLPALNANSTQGCAIVLVLDAGSYQLTRFDNTAIKFAGLEYHLYPLTLASRAAKFHPKLFVFRQGHAATVLIASANVTLTGWKKNLEVVDRLILTGAPGRDRDACTVLAQFMKRLPALATEVDDALADALAREAVFLESLGAGPWATTALADTPTVLHNLDESILSQTTRLIPADKVRAIDVVSPYFDPDASALLALAQNYPKADLRILRDSRDFQDLDGRALAPLKERLGVFRITSAMGAVRALHAKAVMLSGPRDAWLVTGSANMTLPGWSKSTSEGGNVELVTMRHASGTTASVACQRVGITSLLDQLALAPVSLKDLTYKTPEKDDTDVASIRILQAEEHRGAVDLTLASRDLPAKVRRVRIELHSHARAVIWEGTEVSRDNDVTLRVPRDTSGLRDLLEDELAIGVTVEAEIIPGTFARGFRWLERPSVLNLSPSQRAGRRALAGVLDGRFDGKSLVGAFMALLALAERNPEVFEPLAAPNNEGLGHQATSDHTRSRTVRSFLSPQGHVSGTASAFASTVARLLLPMPSSRTKGKDKRKGERKSEREPKVSSRKNVDEETPRQLVNDVVERALKIVDRLILGDLSLTQPVRVRAKELLHIADFLVRLDLWVRSRAPEQGSAAVSRARQDVWRRLWSVTGWEQGRLDAWMVDMWLAPSTRAELVEVFANESLATRVIIGAAASSWLDGIRGPMPADVLVAITIISGLTLDDDAESVSTLLEQQADTIESISDGTLSAPVLMTSLVPASLGDTAGATVARRWHGVTQYCAGAISLAKAREIAPPVLRDLMREGAKPRFAIVQHSGKLLVCDGCQTVLSEHLKQRLGNDDESIVHCDTCGAIIVPVGEMTADMQRLIATDLTGLAGMRHALREQP